MNERFKTADNIRETEHVWIPMPDGTRLAARMWQPVTRTAVPAIVEYIPYRKNDMVRARDERNHPFFAAHGYVCLRVDMRGSGDSEGIMTDMYSGHELADARDMINWIADQPWCDGRVGMFGTSWGGTASLQASLDAPEALKAVIAVCATHDRYEDDIHHMGGCILTDTFEWAATLPAILASPPSQQVGPDWMDRWQARLDALSFPVEHWLREEARGQYWRHGSITHQSDRISCPVFAVGGWSDRYSNSVMPLVDARPDLVWGLVGPWGHHYPDQAHPGPGIGFQQVALDWWDHWLKRGKDPDWPKLRVWLGEFDPPSDAIDRRNGSWIETGPPAAETQTETFLLTHDGLMRQGDADTGFSGELKHDLRHGEAAGDTGYFGRFGGLPQDQIEDDARCLVFDTPPLIDDIILYGSVEVDLMVSGAEPANQLTLRLNDIAPDGRSSRVALAIQNLAFDGMLDVPHAPCGPELRRVRIRFHTKAYRFRRGHCVRLSIGTSYWPIIWTPPELGTLHIQDCSMRLPVMDGVASPLRQPLPAPRDLPENKSLVTLSAPRLSRRFEKASDGTIVTGWDQNEVGTYFPEIDTVFAFETHAKHVLKPPDPLSARSHVVHKTTFKRSDGIARLTSELDVRCTRHHYLLDGTLSVTWNGEEIFRRHWPLAVPRRLS